jgi:membrane protein required for colicin V production
MTTTFNLFDLIFLGLTFFLAVFGFFRGFIKELAAFIIWIISISASYFIAPFLSDLLLKYSESKTAIYASSRIIIFIFMFLTLSFSTSEYIKGLSDKIPASFNRSFGVLFGISKSILIFSIIYSAVYNATIIVSKKQDQEVEFPKWMIEAKSGPLLKVPASALNPLVKKFVNAVTENFYNVSSSKNLDDKINEIDKEDKVNKNAKIESDKKSENIYDYDGYSKKDIEKMNRLIDIIAK